MACERDRITELKKYIENKGIILNIGKTKARGNKGFFKYFADGRYRIDISAKISDDSIINVLLHEFTHYIHYCYDKSLKSLDFVFKKNSPEIYEELINVTVNEIPKEFALALMGEKKLLQKEINTLKQEISSFSPEKSFEEVISKIERSFGSPAKYLLMYDKVRVWGKIYSTETISEDFPMLSDIQIAYIKLKAKKRAIRRIGAKITRLNKYYNTPSELFARFSELYFLNNTLAQRIAPNAVKQMDAIINRNEIPEFAELASVLK